MPRVLPTTTATATTATTTPASRFRTAWDSGSILLTLGWGGLALLTVDRYLQWRQRSQRQEAVQMVKTMEEEINREKLRLHLQWQDNPALFHCVIRRAYKQMGGSHGLRGVDIGDVVDILEEGVGPDKAYNLCRLRGKPGVEDQIGWFPIPFMEKCAEPKKSLWSRILRRN